MFTDKHPRLGPRRLNIRKIFPCMWHRLISIMGIPILVRRRLYIETPPRFLAWWRYQMKTFSALLALCEGNSPVTGEFPSQRPVTRSFDVFFDPHPNKQLSKQSICWWFETPARALWRYCNGIGQPSGWATTGMHRPAYVIMMIADILAPNKRQAISNHYTD